LHRIPQALKFERSAQVLYPLNPPDPEIQAIALQGLREFAQNIGR